MRPVIVTGSISIDRIMNFAGSYKDLIAPDKLHVLSLSVLIDSLVDSRGGTAGNIAYNLALLGEHPIILSAVGDNTESYLSNLASLGVDTTRIHKSSLPTSTFTVLTDQDNNQVGGFYPGAMSDSDSLTLSPWYDQDPLVLIGAYDPSCMRRFVAECQAHNLEYIYDIGQQVSNVKAEDLVAGIKSARILILNDYELGVLSKRTKLTVEEIKSQVPLVVTTLGKEGSVIEGNSVKEKVMISAVPGITPLDPTGAGDAYRAGFIHGYLRSLDLHVCGQLGSVAASYTVELVGTQTHSYTIDEFRTRYQQIYRENYAKE